ncbi:hypothetical protein G7046_g3904 [Stylonectria norvegica]|nr:hypothetical protein G7046_g3904 [Stylonectria norvegica]
MDEHKKFLADRLLSEERPITFRLLSRALDVHVNTAKQMLYDFHKYQNALRTDSVYATYLIYGTKTSTNSQADGDVEMASSMPEHGTFSDEVPTMTLTLTREENLNDVLATYQEVTSIHVYSLAPHPQKDLTPLSDINNQVSEYTSKEETSAAAKKYGTITNPQSRLRSRKGRPQVAASAPSKAVKQENAAPKRPVAETLKQEPTAQKPSPAPSKPIKQALTQPSSKDSTPTSSNNSKKPVPSLKRGVSGSLMSSFAKAKPPKTKAATKAEHDVPAALSDDGEADDDDDVVPAQKPAVDAEAIRKSRKEREDELRRMMEEDDDDEDGASETKDDEPADEEMEEAPEPESEPEPKKEDEPPAEVVASSGDGRRRGKRRVMKKNRILDDQGYMVTIQEPGWESFSEDEAPPPAKKQTPAPIASSTAAKPKKSAAKASQAKGSQAKGSQAKGSQGNIMSFFSKK